MATRKVLSTPVHYQHSHLDMAHYAFPGPPESKGTVQSPPKLPAGHLAPSEPETLLQKQSPEELPYQHRRMTKTGSVPNGRPQQVYLFGNLIVRATDRLQEDELPTVTAQQHGPTLMAMVFMRAVHDTPPF